MFYNVRTTTVTDPATFRVTKFDADLNPVASYLTSAEGCECPAGVRHSCRHRDMIPVFAAKGRIDTAWVCKFERDLGTFDWREFVGPLAANEADSPHLPPYSGPPVDHSDAIIAADEKLNGPSDGKGPEQSPLAAPGLTSPLATGRSQPSPIIDTARLRRLLR